MIESNIEFHNTVELEPAAGGGRTLRRFPTSVRNTLNHLGRMVSQDAAGCEIRFVTEAQSFRIALSSQTSCLSPFELNGQDVVIYKGAYQHSAVKLEPGKINHFHITDIGGPVQTAFLGVQPAVRDTPSFPHTVWRILFGRYAATFHELDTFGYPVRAPSETERPRAGRLLCYGSSITNGASPSMYHLCYAQTTARLLGMDLLNQGLSGSCCCEPEVADYLAARDDWDAMTLELGVNMRLSFTPDEFRKRTRYLVEKLIARHPSKPLVLITIFPNAHHPRLSIADSETQRCQLAFDQILRDLHASLRHPNLHLIEGADVLTDPAGLTKDLIHPGDAGHADMAYNLAARLRPILKKQEKTS
jgi:lysophospholipase L1-like esterase